jgi:glyoxylase-like metal-dependent hydrolase (beta-lactamase superfamily II)
MLAAIAGLGFWTGTRAVPDPEIVPLAPNVYAAIRNAPLGLAGNANSLIIVRANDVIVVDAQFTRQATLENLAAIRRLTQLPVSHVINTHWHDDHLAGNQVYRDAFPNVRFVMHANTAEDLVTLGAPNREGQVKFAPPTLARFERLLASGLGIDSTPASAAERASVTNAIGIMRQYVAEAPGFRAIQATDTVRTQRTLGAGDDRVDIRWFGRANTRGDLVVALPGRGIVATGDLVVAPVQYAFNSYPAEWIAVLDSVLAMRPRIVVPGHGPVMRDVSYVESIRRMLARIRDETAASVERGDSVAATLRSVKLDDERRRVTADEKWMNSMFRSFFLEPAVRRAYEQAKAK